jgi:hypothetical protein
VLLLLLRLLLLLLLLRLSERQNARGVLGLLRVGNPQSLLVDGAGRERTSAAERGERSGDLQCFSGHWTSSLSYCGSSNRERYDSPGSKKRVAIRSTQLMSASRTHALVHALRGIGT